MCSQQLGRKVIFSAPIQSNNLFRNTTIANYHNMCTIRYMKALSVFLIALQTHNLFKWN